MRNKLFFPCLLIVLLTLVIRVPAQGISEVADEKAIREVLLQQQNAWNENNLEAFMKGYWKSDSIMFVGSKITKGWNNTLARYKSSYPDKAAIGKLRFEILRMKRLSADTYLLTGNYFLSRINDNPHGIFTLVFQKIGGKWLVIYDHTS